MYWFCVEIDFDFGRVVCHPCFPVGLVLEPSDRPGGGSGSERSDSLPPYDGDAEAGSSISSHTSQVVHNC